MSVEWSYFDQYEWADDKYLPTSGEGETMATQIVTAVAKLIYKWYNDGDVYDNTYAMEGWCNDLSSYANWLVKNTKKADVLYRISKIHNADEYEEILKDLTDATFDEKYLEEMDKVTKVGSIYDCDGDFKFEYEDDDEDWY